MDDNTEYTTIFCVVIVSAKHFLVMSYMADRGCPTVKGIVFYLRLKRCSHLYMHQFVLAISYAFPAYSPSGQEHPQ